MTAKHVMIDFETIGTQKDAAILTFGAVKFDPYADGVQEPGENYAPHFYRRLDFEDCKRCGMRVEKDAIDWWFKQSTAARAEAFAPDNRLPLRAVLSEFVIWFSGAEFIWSHGAGFDISILTTAYFLCGMQPPWKYPNERDTRTIYHLASVSVGQKRLAHHSFWDAHAQALAVQQAYRALGLTQAHRAGVASINGEIIQATQAQPLNPLPDPDWKAKLPQLR